MTPLPNYKRLRLRYFLPLLFLIPLLTVSLFSQSQQPKDPSAPPPTSNELQARETLNKGVNDFKNGQYEDAIQDFTRAKILDPNLLNARLYLATTYASLYIPGTPSEANVRQGQAAIKEYQETLTLYPGNLTALDGLASMLFYMAGTPFDPAKFEESKSNFIRHIQLRPEDPEPYYWVGVIDWTLSFRANAQLRSAYNQTHTRRPVRDTEPMPGDLREAYRRNCATIILEGVDHLQKAIQRRPDYDDAMAYLNLLYRRQADIAETQDERDHLLQRADDLVDQVKEIKQRRLESAN